MRASIITATYNLIKSRRKDSFKKCVESVKSQLFDDYEHIIIDNASTDGTLDLIEEYPHLKCISTPDTGIFNAFNKGVWHASGDYIAFLNSDDFYHSNLAIKSSVEALEQSQADYSYAPVTCTYPWVKPIIWEPQMYGIFFFMPVCHQSIFCKRHILLENPFDENYKFVGDYDWLIKIFLKKYNGVEVKENFVTYSLKGNTVKYRLDCIKECRSMFRKTFEFFGPLTDKQLEVYPPELLDELSVHFPDKQKFYETYKNSLKARGKIK